MHTVLLILIAWSLLSVPLGCFAGRTIRKMGR